MSMRISGWLVLLFAVGLQTGCYASDILKLKDVQGLQVVASAAGDDVCHVAVSGLAFHSALVVDRIDVRMEDQTAVILVHLAPTRPNASGSFSVEVPADGTVNAVAFGLEAAPVWSRADGC